MKGKKTDTDFVSNFIIECAQNNKNSPDQITKEAEAKILAIDSQIREIENLKKLRSKLLDVVNTFKTQKPENKPEGKSLHLFEIKNHHICKKICNILKENPADVAEIKNLEFELEEILFCIKQLIEYKVISKTGNVLIRGSKFDEYIKLVLQES